MLGGSLKRKEIARKILTQTVNFLTAKMEIGGPMANLYLLGNPDHYTSHDFVPVYWKNYIREVLKPKMYEDKTLYEWIQMATRVKVCKGQKHDVDIDDDELDLLSEVVQPSESKSNRVQNYESDAESDHLNLKDNDRPFDDNNLIDDDKNSNHIESDSETIGKLQPFLRDHPLYKTHHVCFDESKYKIVPNFVGGSLPI
ncbi:hypothetical protein L208DRAFT_1342413 [Tricholoma matsutake]|nr:hypothetical protein L208DRAFT_1342413 [Tricholoma matsutake 945]